MSRLTMLGLFTTLALAMAWATACGPGSDTGARGGVTIEPLASTTPRTGVAIGGKPAGPTPAATAEPTTTAATGGAAPVATEAEAPTTTPEPPLASDGSSAPTDGRWIDVDVTNFAVRLMNGTAVVREIAPVGVGEQIDTGEYASTQTGLFSVNSKIEALVYDPPYDTYISHWVGFDPDKANGFHSFLKDKDGAVVDASTGRVSNGCIRTGAPDVMFAFAEVGMPVWVHR